MILLSNGDKAVTKRVFEKIKRLRVICLSILVTAVIILFLSWIYNEYGQQTMLLWLAILLAATTAVINAWSLDKTKQSVDLSRHSLDLIRSSIRPFLFITNVRYRPTSSSDNPQIALTIRNTGPLPASQIDIEFELRFSPPGGNLEHGGLKQPTIMPDDTREIVFNLLPWVREIEATANAFLSIETSYYFGRQYIHTNRYFSLPPGVKKLDRSFDFVFLRGGEYW